MNWFVGQRIVCIRNSKPLISGDITHPYMKYWDANWKPEEPICGEVYTIRRIWNTKCGISFWLNEIIDPLTCFHEELFRGIPPQEEKSGETTVTVNFSSDGDNNNSRR